MEIPNYTYPADILLQNHVDQTKHMGQNLPLLS